MLFRRTDSINRCGRPPHWLVDDAIGGTDAGQWLVSASIISRCVHQEGDSYDTKRPLFDAGDPCPHEFLRVVEPLNHYVNMIYDPAGVAAANLNDERSSFATH